MMQTISGKDNPLVKKIARLQKSAKARREEGVYIIEGLRLCKDALASLAPFEFVCFTRAFYERNADICDKIAAQCGSYELSEPLMSKISDTKSPQGILCGVKILDKNVNSATIKTSGKILALENISDPNNLGAILRTAEALGSDCVLITSDSCDVYSPKVLRASMGAVFRQNIAFTDNLPAFIEAFNKSGVSYAAVLSPEAENIQTVSFQGNVLAVVGNEAGGVTAASADACGRKIIIPMKGGAESLNASVAASIIIWEMMK